MATFPTQWTKQFNLLRGFTDATTYDSIDKLMEQQKDKADKTKKKRKKATISSLQAKPLTTSGRPLTQREMRNAIVKKVQRTTKSRQGRQAVYSSEESSSDSDSK